MPPGVIASRPLRPTVPRWTSAIGARVGRSAANGEPKETPCPQDRNAWTTSGSWPVRLREGRGERGAEGDTLSPGQERLDDLWILAGQAAEASDVSGDAGQRPGSSDRAPGGASREHDAERYRRGQRERGYRKNRSPRRAQRKSLFVSMSLCQNAVSTAWLSQKCAIIVV